MATLAYQLSPSVTIILRQCNSPEVKCITCFYFHILNLFYNVFTLTAMSRNSKRQLFGSDVRRKLPAAEAAQKADILTFSSGHLGPRNLNPPPKDAKPRFWDASRRKEKSLKEGQGQTQGCVRKKENTSGAAFAECEGLRSKQDKARDCSSHAGTRADTSPTEAVYCSLNPLSQPLKDASQKESGRSSVQANLLFFLKDSNHETLDTEGQLEVKLKNVKEGVKVAEVFERKLQNVKTVTQHDIWKLGSDTHFYFLMLFVCVSVCCCLTQELKKLSALSWPSRDRLAVFSDVFDDVCEAWPVFGRILREIKVFPFPLYPLAHF